MYWLVLKPFRVMTFDEYWIFALLWLLKKDLFREIVLGEMIYSEKKTQPFQNALNQGQHCSKDNIFNFC